MKSLDKSLKYYELVMYYLKTKDHPFYTLPDGYHYEFYKPGDEKDWIAIHITSGEFTSSKKALAHFYEYYDSFIAELPKRCFFIVTSSGEKIATSTVSLTNEDDFTATVDWLAIKKEYQGKGLAKPLISKTISLANELGHEKLLLHTQTHSYLAAKLYLDMGFSPYKMTDNLIGWQILKTLTNHQALKKISLLSEEEIYDNETLAILTEVEKLHQDYTYEIWNKDKRNDVFVREDNIFYEYKYFINDNKVKLKLINTEKD